MSVTVIGIRFKEAGKIYYFDPGDLPITTKDHVIVETARGVEYGDVVVGIKQVDDSEVVPPLKKVIRIAMMHVLTKTRFMSGKHSISAWKKSNSTSCR